MASTAGVFTGLNALLAAVSNYCDNVQTPNGDIAGWDVSRVESFKSLFSDQTTCNLTISSWDTSQVITFMVCRFAHSLARSKGSALSRCAFPSWVS